MNQERRTEANGNVIPLDTPPGRAGGGNGSTPWERLARIETRLDSIEKHGATKTDIERLRSWILGGVIAAFVIALTIGYIAPPDRSPSQTAPQSASQQHSNSP